MPTLIKLDGDKASLVEDAFVFVGAEDEVPASGDVIVTLPRFASEGDALLSSGRRVGVRIEPSERVEDLAYDLPRLAVVELNIAKFRDGRPFSSAQVLRGRLAYQGEIRAVGEVIREQALMMVRCGFHAFEPSDGSSAAEWLAAAHRYRHVYQRAVDEREPIFVEREQIASGIGHNRPDGVGA